MKLLNLKKYLEFIIITTFCLVNSSCGNKPELINVTLKVVDADTKKTRKNDSVELRIEKFGFPVKRYVLVAKYLTDSVGKAKMEIQKDEKYHIIVYGKQLYGATEFEKGELNNGSMVTVEAISLDKR